MELVEAGEVPEAITTRRIAKRADVGVGLINYHFQTKERLLYQILMSLTHEISRRWQRMRRDGGDPVAMLQIILHEIVRLFKRYPAYAHLVIDHDLAHGELPGSRAILPILREVAPPHKPEWQLRALAFHFVVGLEVAFIRHDEAFEPFTRIDLYDDAQRDAYFDLLIEQMVQGASR
jgi:AcrR family transcriptional regulator